MSAGPASIEDAPPTARQRLAHPLLEADYRPELHGLRGLAIALVVLFHVFGSGRVSGGIDVFLAISGFLFTGMLVREAVRTGGAIDLSRYVGRIVRRLLPSAVLVLASTWALGRLLLPPTQWVQLGLELRASLTYVQNWELIDSQLGYAAAGPGTSPLQHFWSMSVQGQFYLLWPMVVIGVVLLSRRDPRRVFRLLLVATGLITVLSFGYASWMHATDQQVAYLHTGARLWQPALGGVAALLAVHTRLSAPVRVVLGWLGVGLVASSGLVLDGGALFPGPAALWPVGGFLLVMAAGSTGTRWGADRWLGGRTLTWIGDIAYPLFLWHWPIVVFTLVVLDQEQLTLVSGSAVIVLSVVLAHLTHHLLETPFTRRPMKRPPLVVLVGSLVIGLGAVSLTQWTNQLVAERDAALAAAGEPSPEHPGAAAIDEDHLGNTGIALVPELAAAPSDNADVYDQDCIQDFADTQQAAEVLTCPGTSPGARRTVVLTGGSHMVHYLPALDLIAEQQDWDLVTVSRSGCHLTSNRGTFPTETDVAVTDSCVAWNAAVLDTISDLEPDAVLTLATTTAPGHEALSVGFVEVWQELQERSLEVVAFRDTARMPGSVPDCLAENDSDPTACGMPRAGAYSAVPPYAGAEGIPQNVTFVDLIDQICTARTCPAVVGNVVLFSDAGHLTATYARTMAPELDRQLRRAAPQLYR